MFARIQNRLMVICIALAVLPLVVVSVIISGHSSQALEQAALTSLQNAARLVALEVDDFVAGHVNELRVVAITGDLREPDKQQELRNLLFQNAAFEEIGLLDTSGQEIARFSQQQVISAADLRARPNAPEFRAVLETNEVYYSPIRFDPAVREPLMTVALPVLDLRTRQLVLVLTAQLSFRPARDLLAQAQLGQGVEAFLVTPDGRVIAHRDPSVVLRETRFAVPEHTRAAGLSGADALLATSTVPLGSTGVTVVAQSPVDQALAPEQENQRIAVVATLLALALAALLTSLLVRQVVRPIEQLAGVAQRIRDGDLSARAATNDRDEVGTLARSFNAMADQVGAALVQARQNQATLAERNRLLEERTRQLEQRDAALQASAERFRIVAESISDVMYEWEIASGRLTWFGDVTGLLGRQPDVFPDTHESWAMLVHPDDQAAFRSQIEECLHRGAAFQGEYRVARSDGSYRILLDRGQPTTDAGGRPAKWYGALTDVTERKRLEGQLRQAQKMESIGLLAGGIAHDFNNLLTAITGYAGLALTSLPPDDLAREDIDEIQKAAARASALTRQLLTFARKQVITPEVLDLNEIVTDVQKLLRRVIGEDVDLVTLPSDERLLVNVDAGQIEQVILNLAVNARDAMPHGGRLTIETHDMLLDAEYARQHAGITAGAYAMLEVSDSGVGMSPEVQAHIFEPFFTTKEPGHGTGLGLATCYGIVKQHGGAIACYSEIGQGTTFRVYLPRASASGEAATPKYAADELPRGAETVLLVEDDPAVRRLTARQLRDLGYTILEATNGIEALQLVRGWGGAPIELIVTDVVMPELGGDALVEQLAALQPAIKTLFISGYTNNTITRYGRLAPGVSFLQKPFTSAQLARKVRAVLDR